MSDHEFDCWQARELYDPLPDPWLIAAQQCQVTFNSNPYRSGKPLKTSDFMPICWLDELDEKRQAAYATFYSAKRDAFVKAGRRPEEAEQA